MTELPILYKQNKNGSVQQWSVDVTDNVITVLQGQVNGAMQSYQTTCVGKNIGRSNETSPSEQAVLEMKAKHIHQIDRKGYSLDVNNLTEKRGPMLVNKMQKHLNKLDFPNVSSLPKLNGLNGIYRLEDGVLNLYSRGLTLYPRIPHLEADILRVMKLLGTTTLAGEIYHHGSSLQVITSWVKKPKEGNENLGFFIFDCPDIPGDYLERTKGFYNIEPFGPVFIIPRKQMPGIDDVLLDHLAWTDLGYEGTVLYNHKAMYEYGTRSLDVLKYKLELENEFIATGFECDKLKHVVYQCEIKEGKPFSVKRKGTDAERLHDASMADSNIGKWLNVSFEMYSDTGIPLKVSGNDFRECSSTGEPLT